MEDKYTSYSKSEAPCFLYCMVVASLYICIVVRCFAQSVFIFLLGLFCVRGYGTVELPQDARCLNIGWRQGLLEEGGGELAKTAWRRPSLV